MDGADVRPFEPADEAAVRRLLRRLPEGFAPWRDTIEVERAVAGWVDSATESARTEDHTLMVAVSGDEIVGFVGVDVQAHYIDGRDGYIGELGFADEDVSMAREL